LCGSVFEMKQRLHAIGRIIGWLVLGGVLALLGLEAATYLFHWRPDVLMQPDERFGYAHIPNARGWWVNIDGPREFQTYVEINSKGLRDREYAYEKPPGVFRILVLGDSFADALEVPLEDAFPKVLEARLNERGRMQVEVINGGVWGYGNDQQLLFYRLEGHKYQPDLVLLAFQSTSDVLENHRELEMRYMGRIYKPFFVLEEGELRLTDWPFPVETVAPPPPRGVLGHVKAWLARHSRFYHVAGRVLKRQLGGLAEMLRAVGLVAPEAQDTFAGGIPLAMYLYAADYPPIWDEAWAVTHAIFVQLNREVADNGGRLAVLLLPDRNLVEDRLPLLLAQHPAMQSREWDLEKPHRIMRDFLAQEDIPTFEMTIEFQARAAESGHPLYYPQDGHWNVDGHHLAGELLAEMLCRRRLAPCEEGSP
jgi:hypothetical protein